VNDSTVLLAGDLAWPITVLVIATTVLATQRAPIGRLIDRLKLLRYPGGEAQLGIAVPEGGADTILTLVDALSRDLTAGTAGEVTARPPARADEIEPIQNREPLGEFEPLPTEEVSNLVMLRTKAANLVSELAFPPPPGGFGPVSATIDVLRNRGVLDVTQADALRDAMDIADQAARGAVVPRRVALAVENSGPAILEQLALLRTVAAAKFEEYVLDTLRRLLPPGWSIDIDRTIPRTERGDDTDRSAPSATHARARVDGLVTMRDRSAVVEVRARLQPGSHGQIEAVRDWLKALPSDLPVLLVMLGEGLTGRELRRIRDSHDGAVEVLLWDRDADALIMILRELLEASDLLVATR
jgi:hypothetical protein